ncbi:MAG: DUF2889 domain-containing protein [Acidimicrobiales bacterium]|jgi:hypothetical protein
MLFLPEAGGPSEPVPTTIDRRPGSVRRTSTIDTARPDGFRGDLVMTARGRDLRTDSEATSVVTNQVDLSLRVDGSNRQVLSIASSPPLPGLDQLVGCPVGPGFRSRVKEACPGECEAGTLLHLLLDDLPGAALVSGYSAQRAGALDQPRRRPQGDVEGQSGLARMMASQDDLCAGWAHEGTLMVTVRSTGEIPVSTGPPAPSLERSDDPLAWHPMPPLPPHAMRRRRRLDVVRPDGSGEPHRFDAHFRDSHMDQDGAEWVVHEYSATGAFDVVGGRVLDIGAEARVLPWMECPGAVASAERLSGMPIAELRTRVRREFTGTSTCTHLNDTLRSLGDLEVLVGQMSN